MKNCGYPFHLQIATKEFLNELVRKFPERPLAVYTPAQNRILELIQEWYQTLCKSSRYKEDLIHIKDMHRLLSYKGYRFPQLKGASASVLNPVNVSRNHGLPAAQRGSSARYFVLVLCSNNSFLALSLLIVDSQIAC